MSNPLELRFAGAVALSSTTLFSTTLISNKHQKFKLNVAEFGDPHQDSTCAV